MTITNTGRRIALVGMLALVAALIPFSGASADHLVGEVTNLDADDNAGAAIAWSEDGAFEQSHLDADPGDDDFRAPERVLIGRDDLFADNLASGALQASDDTGTDGPLLLTDSEVLDPRTAEEIERLADEEDGIDVVILGGVVAISDSVSEALEALDSVNSVERIAGETRVETAIEVTRENGSNVALLARAYDDDGGDSSQAFVDSLAAGAWAAEAGVGVLLTQTEVLTESVADFLEEGDIDEIIIIGGFAAVSASVQGEVAAIIGEENVSRVGGSNRFATAANIAEARNGDADGYILSQGADLTDDGFAQFDEREAWADGLPAAATSAIYGWPVLLADGERVPDESSDAVSDGTESVVCGPYVPEGTCTEFADGIFGETSSFQGFITDTDFDNDTYTMLTDSDNDLVVVEYDEDDNFTVDGEESDIDGFEDEAEANDYVIVTVDTDSEGNVTATHDLLTTVDQTLGTVTETGEGSYTLLTIEFTTTTVEYSEGDIFLVDGELVDFDDFEEAVDQFDEVLVTEFGDGSFHHDLTNLP